MKIEDLKVGRVYRAKRPRGVHRLDGSYVNDRQILYISPLGNGAFWATLELELETEKKGYKQ